MERRQDREVVHFCEIPPRQYTAEETRNLVTEWWAYLIAIFITLAGVVLLIKGGVWVLQIVGAGMGIGGVVSFGMIVKGHLRRWS
jgi:hypothetical protein